MAKIAILIAAVLVTASPALAGRTNNSQCTPQTLACMKRSGYGDPVDRATYVVQRSGYTCYAGKSYTFETNPC